MSMISYIQGKIIDHNKDFISVSNGFIGYQVFCTKNLLQKIELKQTIQLFIHTKVKEDSISLYGFSSKSELNLFTLLINISGIGPKIALEILSINTSDFQKAILQNNTHFISKIPGIGKKTAERLILELKSKIDLDQANSEIIDKSNLEKDFEEFTDALNNLGYQKHEVNKFLNKYNYNGESTEELITIFLKNSTTK